MTNTAKSTTAVESPGEEPFTKDVDIFEWPQWLDQVEGSSPRNASTLTPECPEDGILKSGGAPPLESHAVHRSNSRNSTAYTVSVDVGGSIAEDERIGANCPHAAPALAAESSTVAGLLGADSLKFPLLTPEECNDLATRSSTSAIFSEDSQGHRETACSGQQIGACYPNPSTQTDTQDGPVWSSVLVTELIYYLKEQLKIGIREMEHLRSNLLDGRAHIKEQVTAHAHALHQKLVLQERRLKALVIEREKEGTLIHKLRAQCQELLPLPPQQGAANNITMVAPKPLRREAAQLKEINMNIQAPNSQEKSVRVGVKRVYKAKMHMKNQPEISDAGDTRVADWRNLQALSIKRGLNPLAESESGLKATLALFEAAPSLLERQKSTNFGPDF